MEGVFFFLVTMFAIFWVNWARNAPWRRYHEAYIAPLEASLKVAKSKRAGKERSLTALRAKADLFTKDFRDDMNGKSDVPAQLRQSGQEDEESQESIRRLELEIAEIDSEIEYLRSKVSHARSSFRRQKELGDPYDDV